MDQITVAVPDTAGQEELLAYLASFDDVLVSRGPEHDLLTRTIIAAKKASAEIVVRVTSDCPFIDPSIVDAVCSIRSELGSDYVRTAMNSGFPLGLDCEAVSISALQTASESDPDNYEQEHCTPFIWRRPDIFSQHILDFQPDLRHWRLVVDTEKDLELARKAYEGIFPKKPNFGIQDLITFFSDHPGLLSINANVEQTAYRQKDVQ